MYLFKKPSYLNLELYEEYCAFETEKKKKKTNIYYVTFENFVLLFRLLTIIGIITQKNLPKL